MQWLDTCGYKKYWPEQKTYLKFPLLEIITNVKKTNDILINYAQHILKENICS